MIYNVQELFTRLVNSGRHGIVQKIVKQEKKKKAEKERERNGEEQSGRRFAAASKSRVLGIHHNLAVEG